MKMPKTDWSLMSRVWKFGSEGRGKNFPPFRGFAQACLRLLYPCAWPAQIGRWFPGTSSVERTEYELGMRPAGTTGSLTLAFLSDLHIGPTTPAKTLEQAASMLHESHPDVILLGGDYLFLEATDQRVDQLVRWLDSLPRVPTIAVMGNHDLWYDNRKIERGLEQAGVRLLVNDAVRLDGDFSDVAILGVDDPWAGEPDVSKALDAAGDAEVRVALCHSPECLPKFRTAEISLLMCGHTHGGQIALPPKKPVTYGGRFGRDYIAGLYSVEHYQLFVSRGIGTVVLPFRLFARPELTLFRLIAREEQPVSPMR